MQYGSEDAGSFTYCGNCGSINCPSHTKIERLEGTPICTGCAVTDQFLFKTKYFYSEANRDEFQAQYDQMPMHEKAMENKPLVAGLLTMLLVALVAILSTVGI
ncbi:hypothetical protein GJ634_04445 [Halobacterium sp. CBA1126]|nr:hypothetical protein [Halobacterium sp. CBA1126]MUV60039.1 hypothetical protein [Halobacterium sp. CBA1126]